MGLDDFIEDTVDTDTSSHNEPEEQPPDSTTPTAEYSPSADVIQPYKENEGMPLTKECPRCRTESHRDKDQHTGEYTSSFSCPNSECGIVAFFAGYSKWNSSEDTDTTDEASTGFLDGAEHW